MKGEGYRNAPREQPNAGVYLRLRLTNSMCTSQSLASGMSRILSLVHGKEQAKPVPSLCCSISLQNA